MLHFSDTYCLHNEIVRAACDIAWNKAIFGSLEAQNLEVARKGKIKRSITEPFLFVRKSRGNFGDSVHKRI